MVERRAAGRRAAETAKGEAAEEETVEEGAAEKEVMAGWRGDVEGEGGGGGGEGCRREGGSGWSSRG